MIRLSGFGHVGLTCDTLMVSKFHNGIHDPKGQNTIPAIVKFRETLYRRHTVPATTCSEVNCLFFQVSLWKQRVHQGTKSASRVQRSERGS